MTTFLDALPAVTETERARILSAPRTEEAHRGLMAEIPAMTALQTGGAAPRDMLPDTLSVVAWNVERCLFPVDSARHIAPLAPQVVLLSEVDHGMARTGQRNTTAEMARELGMTYVFGVEFFELDLGGPTEMAFCRDDFNAHGWHGNAILSAVQPDRVTLIRLDDHGHWFNGDDGAGDPQQPRLGGRMAIAAVLPARTGPVCVVSTHLESNAPAQHRHEQFKALLDALENFAPGLPVVIGGDLNTGNHLPPRFDWRDETLFSLAEIRGYDWSATPAGVTTRPSLITPHPERRMKLDWFFSRGLACLENRLLPAIDADNRPLSDHEAIWCRLDLSSSP